MKWGCVGHINMNNTASRSDQLYVGDFSSRNEHFSLASNLVQLRRMSI